MPNEKSEVKTENRHTANDSTDMAVIRTVMAADRSMMAWLRTGLALISFGFTIYKFLEYSREQLIAEGRNVSQISSPKVIGLFLIGLGIISLLMGIIENEATIRNLKENHVFKRIRYSVIMSVIILVFGIVLFLAVVLRISGI